MSGKVPLWLLCQNVSLESGNSRSNLYLSETIKVSTLERTKIFLRLIIFTEFQHELTLLWKTAFYLFLLKKINHKSWIFYPYMSLKQCNVFRKRLKPFLNVVMKNTIFITHDPSLADVLICLLYSNLFDYF